MPHSNQPAIPTHTLSSHIPQITLPNLTQLPQMTPFPFKSICSPTLYQSPQEREPASKLLFNPQPEHPNCALTTPWSVASPEASTPHTLNPSLLNATDQPPENLKRKLSEEDIEAFNKRRKNLNGSQEAAQTDTYFATFLPQLGGEQIILEDRQIYKPPEDSQYCGESPKTQYCKSAFPLNPTPSSPAVSFSLFPYIPMVEEVGLIMPPNVPMKTLRDTCNATTIKALKSQIKRFRPDIMFLSETKANKVRMKEVLK